MMAFKRISETNEEMICGKIYENISLKVIYTEYCSVKVEKNESEICLAKMAQFYIHLHSCTPLLSSPSRRKRRFDISFNDILFVNCVYTYQYCLRA